MDIEELVHAHTNKLLRGALSLGFSLEEAKDLVQSVWVTFLEVRDKFQGRSSIKTFLFGILYNKARELRRSDRKVSATEDMEEVLSQTFDHDGRWRTPPIGPERFLHASRIASIIDDCLSKLPLNQRIAFCYKEIEGYETEEVCEITSQSATNLGVLLFRAKSKLRSCIETKARGRDNL